MCYIKVHQDLTRNQRRLRLSSIAPIATNEDDEANEAANEGDEYNTTNEMLLELLRDLARIRLSSDAMEKKIKKQLKQPKR